MSPAFSLSDGSLADGSGARGDAPARAASPSAPKPTTQGGRGGARVNSQADRSQRSTRALLDSASALILEGGFSALTLAAIGERAGYSRGLATARFGSKDAMIQALLDRAVGRDARVPVPPSDLRGLDAALHVLADIERQIKQDPEAVRVLYALIFEAVSGPNAQLREQFTQTLRKMRAEYGDVVRRGMDDGSIRPDVDPDAETVLVIAGIRGIAYMWLIDPVSIDPVVAFRNLANAVRLRLEA